MSGKETALYRHFDARGRLLYVGISLSAVNRLSQHASQSGWASLIRSVTVEMFPSRNMALHAEKAAIQGEKPIYNKVHNTSGKKSVPIIYQHTNPSVKPDDPPDDKWLMSTSANRYMNYTHQMPPPNAQIIYYRNGKLIRGQFIWLKSVLDAYKPAPHRASHKPGLSGSSPPKVNPTVPLDA